MLAVPSSNYRGHVVEPIPNLETAIPTLNTYLENKNQSKDAREAARQAKSLYVLAMEAQERAKTVGGLDRQNHLVDAHSRVAEALDIVQYMGDLPRRLPPNNSRGRRIKLIQTRRGRS